MFLPVFICLSVCLLARLLKNACMHLHVSTCVSTDFGTWTNGCWNRIAFSDIVCAATRNFITSEKSHVQVLGARRSSDA